MFNDKSILMIVTIYVMKFLLCFFILRHFIVWNRNIGILPLKISSELTFELSTSSLNDPERSRKMILSPVLIANPVPLRPLGKNATFSETKISLFSHLFPKVCDFTECADKSKRLNIFIEILIWENKMQYLDEKNI